MLHVPYKGSAPATGDPGKPRLGITAFVATIYAEPRETSRKLGYLRVGATVGRAEEPGLADGRWLYRHHSDVGPIHPPILSGR